MPDADRFARLFPRPDEVPAEHRLPGILEQREYLVAGEIRIWEGPLAEIRSPVCLARDAGAPEPALVGRAPAQDEPAALAALAAARRAWDGGRGRWPTWPVAERIRCVEEFAARMRRQRDEVVRLLMWEIGKTLADSGKEFDRTLEYIAETVEALKELDRAGSRFANREGIFAQVRRAPLGATLCLGPYNYPLNETFTTLIPALIMGNTAVFKPARLGVLLHRPLLEAWRDCFPPGVVNTVYGEGAKVVGPLMASGQVDCLAFIGSSRVADLLKHQHPAPHRLRCVLGLGAKNPALVLADADLDQAVRECALGALSFNGQRCTALKIIFVQERIAAQFAARLAREVENLIPGLPWEPQAQLTPLPVPGKPAELGEWIAEAVAAGARVLNAGGGVARATYLHPAVLFPVAPGTRLYAQEQFGPLVPVVPFRDPAECVRWVEESPYGQQAAIFGRDPEVIARLLDGLVNQVCRVNLNSQCQRGPDALPFTGRKDSAEGTLSVSDALRVFSLRTLAAAKDTPLNREILEAILRGRKSNFLSTDYLF